MVAVDQAGAGDLDVRSPRRKPRPTAPTYFDSGAKASDRFAPPGASRRQRSAFASSSRVNNTSCDRADGGRDAAGHPRPAARLAAFAWTGRLLPMSQAAAIAAWPRAKRRGRIPVEIDPSGISVQYYPSRAATRARSPAQRLCNWDRPVSYNRKLRLNAFQMSRCLLLPLASAKRRNQFTGAPSASSNDPRSHFSAGSVRA